MNALSAISTLYHRCRTGAACLMAALSLLLLWTGFGLSGLLPLPIPAVAGPDGLEFGAARPVARPGDQAALLQSTVDGLALGFGGAFTTAPADEADLEGRREALAGALSALTFNLGAEVYFTAWQGTRIIHSPMSPDAAQLDFATALDGRGAAFVRGMEGLAENGGGFLRVSLPRQLTPPEARPGAYIYSAPVVDSAQGETARPLTQRSSPAEEPLPVSPATSMLPGDLPGTSETDIFCLPPGACPLREGALPPCAPHQSRQTPEAEMVEQVVYVRGIPGSEWHIAAFMPATPNPPLDSLNAFSPVWTASRQPIGTPREDLLSRGLCLSGFSLAGLVGLMLTPLGRRRPEDDALTPWWQDLTSDHPNSRDLA